jgi:hypothetical protein
MRFACRSTSSRPANEGGDGRQKCRSPDWYRGFESAPLRQPVRDFHFSGGNLKIVRVFALYVRIKVLPSPAE